MALIHPRLTDFHGIQKPQAALDFAIPFFDEDIPLYVDPFLLWKSPSQMDKALHGAILNAFNNLGYLAQSGKEDEAVRQLIIASECDEVGLGMSATRKGHRIGEKKAHQILTLFADVPAYEKRGFHHFEEIQLYIDGISSDRVCDLACSFMKSFLIDYTMDQCDQLGIPKGDCTLPHLYDPGTNAFEEDVKAALPLNPETGEPLLLVPKRWLRFNTWINYDNYFKDHCPVDDIVNPGAKIDRVKVLNFNRQNYGVVEAYIAEKERTVADCENDPLFQAIPVTSARRKLKQLKAIPSGNDDRNDKKYEDVICQLMASLMYPHMDFADDQSRTDSGTHIRDLIFYNNRDHEFLRELFDDYDSKQIVMEIKNVKKIEREHINQLNRYMTDELGKFSVLITRNPLPRARLTDVVSLWAGQRRCIIILTDADIELMVELFESRQRLPLDVIKKKYVEFRRACPS